MQSKRAKPKGSYIWAACIDCGRERWTKAIKEKALHLRCVHCSNLFKAAKGEKASGWKGGKYIDNGYIRVWVSENDFFYPMVMADGYVLEHRLVMAKQLGRNLHSWEYVHHKNGVKDDNRIKNLELSTASSHSLNHSKGYKDGYIKGYQDAQTSQIMELKKEIKLLQWQIKEGIKDAI